MCTALHCSPHRRQQKLIHLVTHCQPGDLEDTREDKGKHLLAFLRFVHRSDTLKGTLVRVRVRKGKLRMGTFLGNGN